jgi:hypothetical protein
MDRLAHAARARAERASEARKERKRAAARARRPKTGKPHAAPTPQLRPVDLLRRDTPENDPLEGLLSPPGRAEW